MSKRAGEIVELDEILDEVGVDAARFFFIMLAMESPLTFDLKLAVEKESENPVYYVQYGHARIASVLRRALPEDAEAAPTAALGPLCIPRSSRWRDGSPSSRTSSPASCEHLAPHRFGALRARRRRRFPSVLHGV